MFRVTGTVADDSRNRAAIVYFGELPQFGEWTSAILGEACSPELVQVVTLPQVLLRKIPGPNADLMLYPVNPLTERLFLRRGWRIVPVYVSSVIRLNDSLEAALRANAKRDRRLFRKLGLKLVLLKKESDFEEFYTSMLVPTITKRHGVNAHISDYSSLRKVFERGWLLGCYEGNEWLVGRLLAPEGPHRVLAANVGWRHGEEEILRRHIVPASLYGVIEWAATQGFHFFNLGSSSPFVNDGVLNYKLRYNVRLELPQITYEDGILEGARGFVGAHYNLASESGREILHYSPVIEKRAGGPGVIAWRSETPKTFQPLVEKGLPWLDLAEVREMNG